jgi:hypothetical protein
LFKKMLIALSISLILSMSVATSSRASAQQFEYDFVALVVNGAKVAFWPVGLGAWLVCSDWVQDYVPSEAWCEYSN